MPPRYPLPVECDLLANRPAASQEVLGLTFYATNTGQKFLCVCDQSGAFLWDLIGGASPLAPVWSAQADWTIDPVGGNDGNAGTTQLPIKTLTEWFRRVGQLGVKTQMVVHLLTPGAGQLWPATDEPRGVVNVMQSAGGSLRFDGRLGVRLLRAGVFNAAVALVPATNTERTATDAGASWASPIVDRNLTTGTRIRNTTAGARLNSRCWPDEDLGAGRVAVSEPMQAPVFPTDAFSQSLTTINAGDSYALEQLVFLPSWGLSFSNDVFQETVQFNDLAFSPTAQAFLHGAGVGSLALYDCDLGLTLPDTNGALCVNCRGGAAGYFSAYGFQWWFAGLLTNGINVANAGNLHLDQRVKSQEALGAFPGGNVWVHSFQAWRTAFSGIIVEPGNSALTFNNGVGAHEVCGAGNPRYGIETGAGCLPTYDSAVGLTLTGALGDCGIGRTPTVKTWAQLPFIQSDIAAGVGTKISGLTQA